MNKEEQQRVTTAFKLMNAAEFVLQRAADLLAEFGEDVPSVNVEALKLMAEETNKINQANEFIRSFIRVSTLQQVVPKEAKKSEVETKKDATGHS